MKWIVAFGLCLFLVMPAAAETRRMGAKPSAAQLQSACDAAGGTFVEHPPGEIEGDPGSYACHKENCDGKGGTCTVSCGSEACTAVTPLKLAGAQTLVGILQNGSNVVRAKPVTGGQSLGDPGIGLRPAEEKEAEPNGCSLC